MQDGNGAGAAPRVVSMDGTELMVIDCMRNNERDVLGFLHSIAAISEISLSRDH